MARKIHISDYYVTPVSEIELFLKEFNKHENIFDQDIYILDPCAGGCDAHEMSYPKTLNQIGIGANKITTIDIREDSLADIKTNYLQYDCKDKYDVIITNPPFNISREIIEKTLDDVKDKGFVIMLLRLNYFGSKSRKHLWDNYMPKYCFVHHKRMSFTDNGKTDSVEYSHMVWQKGYCPEFTLLKEMLFEFY